MKTIDAIAHAQTLAQAPSSPGSGGAEVVAFGAESLAARRLRAERAKALFGEDAEPIMKIGRFVLEDQLGAGGQGAVYVAFDPELDRKVALKRLHAADAQRARRLLEEAKALARFKHDNVVQIYEVGTDELEGPFMVMELVDGTPLRQWLREQPRTWLEIVDVLVRVAHGLAALHDKGVVHRDVKPDNVIIDTSGRVKLVDLGIALVTESAATTARDGKRVPETGKGEIAGTYGYMAPEQLLGEGVDARSDQYGYCVMMHEALYQVLPRRRGKHKVQRTSGRGEGSAVQGRIPAALDRVLERGLRHEAADRFESMTALAARLEAIVRWRRWGVPGVAAAVMLVAVVGGVAWALQPPEVSPCGRPQTGAELWSQARREAVQGVFLGSDAPAAGVAFTAVDTMLTSYAAELDLEHAQACAALVDRELEPAVAHARLSCLARSQGVLTEVVEQLATASADEVSQAPERLGRLPILAECSSPSGAVEACDADEPVIGHEEDVRNIGLKLQAAESRIMLGRYEDGLQLAKAAVDLAAPEALAHVRARAWLVHGRLAYEGQQLDTALGSLEEALSLAERHACDGVAAEALTLMAKVRALRLGGDAEEALRWSQRALDKLERLGDEGLRRADALNSRGLVLERRLGRYDEADAHYREAAELREQYLPASALALSDTLLNRGSVLSERGRLDEAIAAVDRALALRIEALGIDHPGLFKLYANLGNHRFQQGEIEAAEAAYRRGIELASAGLGPQNRDVAKLRLRMASVFDRQRRFDQAIEEAQQALTIFTAVLEPDDLQWIHAWGAVGQIHLDAGQPSEAVPWLEKVWRLVSSHPQAGPLERALAAYRLGSAEAATRAPERALPWLQQALDVLEAARGDAPPSGQMGDLRAHVQLDRGETLLELGRADEAVTALEEATRWWEDHDSNPERLAFARFGLARAIVARDGRVTDATRSQVGGLARETLAWLDAQSWKDSTRVEVVAWMSKHGLHRAATQAAQVQPTTPITTTSDDK
jgi:tetratricopeptide (TPR) repeat protein/predicted Ser/Thr protein kinase